MTTSRHEFTPHMRAVLRGQAQVDRQATLALPLLLGGIPALLGVCAQRSLLEIALLGLVGDGGVGIVAYQQRRTSAVQGADTLAAGTYVRYSGPFTIREVRGSTYTTAWRLLVDGVDLALTDSAELDRAWRSVGEARGTLVYSPEARVLFAAWDRAGWRAGVSGDRHRAR